MANVKWSAFSSGSAIGDTDVTVGTQSGGNVKWAWSAVVTYITGASRTFTGDQTFAGNTIFSTAASGPTLKRGANGRVGTFVANGVTPVTVTNSSIAITDAIIISLNTVGGTVGALPAVQTITASTGFTVAGSALDTSTYNYCIIKNAA